MYFLFIVKWSTFVHLDMHFDKFATYEKTNETKLFLDVNLTYLNTKWVSQSFFNVLLFSLCSNKLHVASIVTELWVGEALQMLLFVMSYLPEFLLGAFAFEVRGEGEKHHHPWNLIFFGNGLKLKKGQNLKFPIPVFRSPFQEGRRDMVAYQIQT